MHGCMDGDGFPIHSNKGSVRVRSIPFFRTVRTLEWTELTNRWIPGVSVLYVHKCAGYEVLPGTSWMFLSWTEIQYAALLFCSSICMIACCTVLCCATWCHMFFSRLVMRTYRTTYKHSTVTRNLMGQISSFWNKQVFMPYYYISRFVFTNFYPIIKFKFVSHVWCLFGLISFVTVDSIFWLGFRCNAQYIARNAAQINLIYSRLSYSVSTK